MARYIEIELNGVTVKAVLREDGAPRTVAAVVQALPLSGRAIHCICSGECVWFESEQVPLVPAVGMEENLTIYFSQGDIALGPRHEFLIIYGRRCASRSLRGYVPYSAFAMVRDLDAMDRFAKVAAPIMSDGSGEIRVRNV